MRLCSCTSLSKLSSTTDRCTTGAQHCSQLEGHACIVHVRLSRPASQNRQILLIVHEFVQVQFQPIPSKSCTAAPKANFSALRRAASQSVCNLLIHPHCKLISVRINRTHTELFDILAVFALESLELPVEGNQSGHDSMCDGWTLTLEPFESQKVLVKSFLWLSCCLQYTQKLPSCLVTLKILISKLATLKLHASSAPAC